MSEERQMAECWRRCADNAREDFILTGDSAYLGLVAACEKAAAVWSWLATQDERRARRRWWEFWA